MFVRPAVLILTALFALLCRIPAGASSLFGYSVSISGSIMVIGDPDATVGANGNQGAVYIYQNVSNVWSQAAELTANDGQAGDLFGSSVQIYNNTVVVGAPGWPAGAGQGAAYVFVKPASGWSSKSFKAELTASDGAPGSSFGTSVGIYGSNAVVGAPGSAPLSQNGIVYLFAEPAGGWATMTQTSEISASQSFGYSVSISGSMMAAGEPAANSNTGAVFVYQQAAGTWTQVAQLTSSDGTPGDLFGTSVSIFNSTVLAGAPGWQGGANTGSAYVFNKPWKERAELNAPDAASGDCFGASVLVDKNIALIGAPGYAAAYVYVQPGTYAIYSTPNAELTVTGAGLAFGTSVSLSQGTTIGGAPGSMAYLFQEPPTGWGNMTQTGEVQPLGGSILPTGLTFASQLVGTGSAAQNVTLTNTGMGMLTISSIEVTGADSGDFSETNTCGNNLEVGANCTVAVIFSPTAAGGRTATLNITDNASASAQAVSLKGKGTATAAFHRP